MSLNSFIQSIPSKGGMSVLSVIKISIFCLLFSYYRFTGIFPRIFTSFLFKSWYSFVIFLIPVDFKIFSSGGIIVICDPESIKEFFFIPFILTVAEYCLFFTSIFIISALAGILMKSQSVYIFSVQFLARYRIIQIFCSAVTISVRIKFLKLPTTIQFSCDGVVICGNYAFVS